MVRARRTARAHPHCILLPFVYQNRWSYCYRISDPGYKRLAEDIIALATISSTDDVRIVHDLPDFVQLLLAQLHVERAQSLLDALHSR